MERSYVCRKQFCGKMFRNHSSLRRHQLLVHTGEKRFKKEPFPFLETSPEHVSGAELLTEDDEEDCFVIATIDPIPSNKIKNCLTDDDDDCFVVEVKEKRKSRKLKEETNEALESDTNQSNNNSGQENDTSQSNNNPGVENDPSQPINNSGQNNDTSQTINNSGLENETNQSNNNSELENDKNQSNSNSGQDNDTSQTINNSGQENDTSQTINNSGQENDTSQTINNSGQETDTSQTINNSGQDNDTRQPSRFHYMPRRSQRIYNRFYYLPRRSERLRKKFLCGRRKRYTHENDSDNASTVVVKSTRNSKRRIVKEQGKKCNEPKRKGKSKQGRAKRGNKQFTLRNKKNDKWATKCRLCSEEFRCLIARQLHELRHSEMTRKRPHVILKKSDDINYGRITSCAQILKSSLAGLEMTAKRRKNSGKQKRKLNTANQTQSDGNRKTLGSAAKQRNERQTNDFCSWKTSTTNTIMNQRPRNKLKKVSERSADHKKLCASSQENEVTKTPNLWGNTSDPCTVSMKPLSICVMCRRPFQSETHRAKHEADHDWMMYSCPCGYKFENFSLLYRHSAVRHKELLNDKYEKRRRLRPYFGGFVHREENVKASGSKHNVGNDFQFHSVNNSANFPIPIDTNVREFHYSERYSSENSNNKQTPICSSDNLAQRSNRNSEISVLSIVPDSLVPEAGNFVTVPDQPVDDNSMLEFNREEADIEPMNSIQNCVPDQDHCAQGNSPNRSDDNFRTAPRAPRNNQTRFQDPMASETVVSSPLPNSSSKTINRVPVMIGKDQIIVEGPIPMNMFRQFSNPISVTEIKKLLNSLTSGKWSMKIENNKKPGTCSVRIEGDLVSVRHIVDNSFPRADENCEKDTTKSKKDGVKRHVYKRKKTPQNIPVTMEKRYPICPKEFENLVSQAHRGAQHKDKRTTSHGVDLENYRKTNSCRTSRGNVKDSVPPATKKRWKRTLTCLETPKRRKCLSKCPLCFRRFTFKTVRDKHVRNHDKMKYRCPAPCLYQFIDFKTFQRHYNDRHRGKLSIKSEKKFRLDKTMKLSVAVDRYGIKRKNQLSHRQERCPSPRTRNFVGNCTCSLRVAEGQVKKNTRVVLEEGTIPCAVECLAENTSFTKRCVAGRLHRYRLTLEQEPLNSDVQVPGTVAENNSTEVDFRRPRSRPVIELDLEDVQEINDNSGMSQFWNESANDDDHDEVSNEITEEIRENRNDGNDGRYHDYVSSESTEGLGEMDNTSSDDDDVSSENTVIMCRDYDKRYEDEDAFSENTQEIEKHDDNNDEGGNENAAVMDSDDERNDEDDMYSENTEEIIEKDNSEGDNVDFSENMVRMYTGHDRNNEDVSSENTEKKEDSDRNDEDDFSSENTDEITREEDNDRSNGFDEHSGENIEEFREDNDRNESSEDNKPLVFQTSSLSDDCRYYNFRSLIVILDDEDYNKKQKKVKTKECTIDSPEKRIITENNQRTQAKTLRLNAKYQEGEEQKNSQTTNVNKAYCTKRRKDKSSIVSFSTPSQEITAETASSQGHFMEEVASATGITDKQSVSGKRTNIFEVFNGGAEVRAQTCFAKGRAAESVISPQIDSDSSSVSEFTVSQTMSTGRSIFESSQRQPYCATSPTEILPGPVSPPPAESSSNSSTQISCEYVIKAFRQVNTGDDDILKEEVCDKSEADMIDVLLVPRSEEEAFCCNVLIPTLQKLNNERKSLAKLEILRTLHNIEFQTGVPSVLNCGMMSWDSHSSQYETSHEVKRFCFTLVLPTLHRLDEERKSLAILEIQRVLHSLRFGLSVITIEVSPK